MNKEILFRHLKNNKLIKLVYTDEHLYIKALEKLKEAEQLNKCEIIPNDINKYMVNKEVD